MLKKSVSVLVAVSFVSLTSAWAKNKPCGECGRYLGYGSGLGLKPTSVFKARLLAKNKAVKEMIINHECSKVEQVAQLSVAFNKDNKEKIQPTYEQYVALNNKAYRLPDHTPLTKEQREIINKAYQ
jgi:hypothetical protein